MLNNFRFISVALTIVLAFSAVAFGQGRTGTIEGTVSDQTGAVIPGATVTIESTGTTTGFSRTVQTDGNGYYIVEVAPGTYKLTAANTGFKSSTRSVSVSVDRASGGSFSLEPGIETTIVDVSSDSAVIVDLGDTKIDTNITKDVIEALPKGTTFGSLLKIAPNVRPEALGAGFQIDGASGAENVFVIDGQEVTNFRTGQLNSNNNLPFELLQEVQIKSTGFEAEY
ncbi:MAG: carboxypeptidase-like regulatory domain-containing protein, partial [Acidobacteriota bacterium]|nr:carboxypeptidase-like regulatory domain-containing protein [Acidobacteriota bacterium]